MEGSTKFIERTFWSSCLAPNKAIRAHVEGESTWGHAQDTERMEIPHKLEVFTYKSYRNQVQLKLVLHLYVYTVSPIISKG